MAENSGLQRLYLAKGDKEGSNVYVDTISLPQHQYDGIRFLYRQFKKGNVGVILNDPPGYGKRVQTVLFLNAMHPVMNLPTLVLCTEGLEELWVKHFRQWTNMGSSVLVQKGNEYNKSMCIIGTLSQISILSRREWGILVVDDNHVSREALRAGINCQYRIWLTSFDMKKSLQTFSLIYKWLYPKDKFNIEDFHVKKKPAALLTNSVRLDAYMENIVIRRKGVAVPLGNNFNTPVRLQVSRKNKDSTGKKIKRSKPLPNHSQDTDTSTESQKTDSEQDTPVKLDRNGEVKDKNESIEDLVVKIENKKNTNMDIEYNDDNMTDATSNHNNKVANHYLMKSGDKVHEKTTARDTGVSPHDNAIPESDSIPRPLTQDGSLAVVYNSDIIDSQNLVIRYDSHTEDNEIKSEIPAKKKKMSNEINVSEDLFSIDIVQSDSKSEKVNNHDINAKTNEINTKNSKNTTQDLPTKNDTKTDEVNSKTNELVFKNSVSENNKTDPQLSGIELKIKQIEMLAMNKFKGSFLDRMLN